MFLTRSSTASSVAYWRSHMASRVAVVVSGPNRSARGDAGVCPAATPLYAGAPEEGEEVFPMSARGGMYAAVRNEEDVVLPMSAGDGIIALCGEYGATNSRKGEFGPSDRSQLTASLPITSVE